MSTSTPDPTSDAFVFQPLLLLPVWCDLQTPSNYAMPESDHDSVIPAQLSYLAIYNPALGPTDETIADQIVFYTSKSSHARRIDGSTAEVEAKKCIEDEENERLRQIGLAQGMVNFASNFSAGKTLEYVETDKAQLVLLELEKDWWIVASIDLTRIPADPPQRSSSSPDSPAFYYSSREMAPPPLLIQQLRRAHSEFLLHHDFKLYDILHQVGRSTFCLFLERFWEKFAWNWELLLTGNPIVDIYNGIKLSAGGELGIGVGEEEWGSGEREVLEDFVTRTDGLVDLVVSRFGDPSPQFEGSPASGSNDPSRWLGADNDPRPSDGVIFTGIGALSRHSLAHVSHWMQCIYRFGDAAYGVGRDPTSLRRRKPRKQRGRQISEDAPPPFTPDRKFKPGIPRPLIMAAPQPIPDVVRENQAGTRNEASPLRTEQKSENLGFPTEAVMKYLTLGYGSSWSFSPKSTSTPPESSTPTRDDPHSNTSTPKNQPISAVKSPQTGAKDRSSTRNSPSGHFVLGPRDDLEKLDDLEERSPEPESENSKPKTRIVNRTLHVHLADTTARKLQVVIYVHQPFMFTFLFDPQTPALSSPSLYSSMHHQLGPLQKPLLLSTSPTMAASRIAMSETSPDPNKRFSTRTQPVYDLVYDPFNLTIRSSIPNIPSMNISSPSTQPINSPARTPSPSLSLSSTPPPWSRVESIAIHHRLLSTYTDTRSRPQELERTSKTQRGWWVVWVRIPHSTAQTPTALSTTPSSTALSSMTNNDDSSPAKQSQAPSAPLPQEAFLIRKASDYISPANHGRVSNSARFFRDLGGASPSAGLTGLSRTTDMAPSKLVEGLGMDARRYIEGLLSLNR
ncbi:uncharacterized protein N7479_008143 [Penicillium vulpinum]|uniref:CCZ1/INTU/HSP4 first Longin domain-containing protein n=1 Tax=Penicillium vulpinum TaxID=29845 RepID=A0A1V6RJZ2_9EURO|nr:uncharacterized protein N7479_008143 [Penicillium vulpinum]KAJ5960993.1 hypothetical protein N7479_008143 [Penicillium vulpinum]OQE01749.1 hypothetical protein PENVUL_c041G00548 [Penicillium vulpinum]